MASLNMGQVPLLSRRLARSFRDACTEEHKQAELFTTGGDTQLDRSVLDYLYGPLLHVVRNAVAHGIEKPEDRRKNSKTPAGKVRLSAEPLSNQVIIEVQDDGAGINAEAVLKRALDRNLVPPGTASLSPEQVVQLLFMPGFSTKESVSSVAGRGVGLDVVKRDIEALNGTVSVSYEAGRGTTWTLKIPLTLSASEALLVRSAGFSFAIPLTYVVKCLRLLQENYIQQNNHAYYKTGDEVLPYYDLHQLLQLPSGSGSSHGILVDSGTGRAILGIHSMIGRREIITKDAGPLLNSLEHISGATSDSDGSLICILKISNLLAMNGRLLEFIPLKTADNPDDQGHKLENGPHVLLVDDSPSVRKMQHKQLRQLGFRVTTAVDGLDAVTQLGQQQFDLVITDLEMPQMDGIMLLQSIRSNTASQNLPVILLTSRAGERNSHELTDMGATACLPKPFSPTDFLKELETNPGLASIAANMNPHGNSPEG